MREFAFNAVQNCTSLHIHLLVLVIFLKTSEKGAGKTLILFISSTKVASYMQVVRKATLS